MSDTVIRVERLGKEYRLGSKQEAYRTLRDTLTGMALAPVRAVQSFFSRNGHGSVSDDFIWALKDVSFEVKRGEVVGIIGRNGAGKSTLLKILSRITEPTTGFAEIHGRVGSLLEVGTGFHLELTGRENIFLNGAILGMGKADIMRKFDEIVAFAEVEKFIDTAVKHYSSGMYLRLAFAVAAHMETDILMVDEVLAVGDSIFQNKCLGKMEEATKNGRTVLFVSHNMAAIRSLCSRGVVLKNGMVSFVGDVEEAIHRYNRQGTTPDLSRKNGKVEFTDVQVTNRDNKKTLQPEDGFEVSGRLHVRTPVPGFRLFCIIQDGDGEILVHSLTDNRELQALNEEGEYLVRVQFPPLWLKPGVYNVHFKLMGNMLSSGKARYLSDSIMLDVSASMNAEMLLGYLTPRAEWTVEKEALLPIIESSVVAK